MNILTIIKNRIRTFFFQHKKKNVTSFTTELCIANKVSGIPLQLRFFMFFIIIATSVILASTLFIMIFDINGSNKDKIEKYAEVALSHTTQTIDTDLDKLIVESNLFAQTISTNIDTYLLEKNISYDDLKNHPEILTPLLSTQFNKTLSIMEKNSCSGAFIILDATVNESIENSSNSRAGIFLKRTNPNSVSEVHSKIHYLRGPASIARENNIELIGQWRMEFDITNEDFFYKVIETAKQNPSLSLSKLYYFTDCFRLVGNSEAAVLLCVPLRSNSGEIYGVCGLEISDRLFKQKYTPNSNEYQNVFATLAPYNDTTLHIEKGMIAGNYFLTGIRCETPIEFSEYKNNFFLYENTNFKYAGIHSELSLYPNDSPYKNEPWLISIMMPKEILDTEILGNNTALFIFITLSLSISFIISMIISKKALHPVTEAIGHIKSKNYENKNTYFEINDLMDFLGNQEKEILKQKENLLKEQTLNNKIEVNNISNITTPMIDNFLKNLNTLSNAEKKVFDLYLEGSNSQEIADKLCLSINTIKTHNRRIFAKLNISTRKELLIYIDMLKEMKML